MNYLSIFGLLLILASPSGIANTLLDKLSLCTKNNDDIQRLACYDEVVDKNVNNHYASRLLTTATFYTTLFNETQHFY